jgi:hypothetical protein
MSLNWKDNCDCFDSVGETRHSGKYFVVRNTDEKRSGRYIVEYWDPCTGKRRFLKGFFSYLGQAKEAAEADADHVECKAAAW